MFVARFTFFFVLCSLLTVDREGWMATHGVCVKRSKIVSKKSKVERGDTFHSNLINRPTTDIRIFTQFRAIIITIIINTKAWNLDAKFHKSEKRVGNHRERFTWMEKCLRGNWSWNEMHFVFTLKLAFWLHYRAPEPIFIRQLWNWLSTRLSLAFFFVDGSGCSVGRAQGIELVEHKKREKFLIDFLLAAALAELFLMWTW